MTYISFNRQLLLKEQLNFYDVERFRVADAFFESILYCNERFPLWEYHIARIKRASELLAFTIPNIQQSDLLSLLEKEKLSNELVRIRISIVRASGNNYSPEGKDVNVLIECVQLNHLFKPIKNLDFFNKMQKPVDPYAGIKSCNALLYVIAKQYALANNLDDVLICNSNNQWIEASSSNIFVIKDSKLYSAVNESGCVLGVLRAFMINFFDVEFVSLNKEFLMSADEIFLTNGIQLIQTVAKIQNKELKSVMTNDIITQLKEKLCV